MKRLFILIASLPLLFVLPKTAYPEKYPFRNYTVDDGLSNASVYAIFQDSDGYMWFGTGGGGACKFDGVTFTTYTTEDGLAYNIIRAIIEDSRGNLWFGTNGGGVSRFNGKNWTIYTTEDGLANNDVWSIIEDREGNLWFGTGGGVSRFNGVNWATYTTEDGLSGNNITEILEDSRGNLWFGAWGLSGVSMFDGEKWINRKFSNSHRVFSVLEDSNGNIWLGGESPRLVKIAGELDSGDYKVFTEKDGLPPLIVWSMLEDSKGNMWFATMGGGGLGMFDGEKWKVFTKENGLPTNDIWSRMLEDKEGNLWFGSQGGGVSRLSGMAFTTFTTADGLIDNAVVPALEDSKGNLWFVYWGTKRVNKYDGENWTTYTIADTIADEFKKISADRPVKDSKGNLWFNCGGEGLSRFDGKKWTTYTAKDWGGDNTWVNDLYLADREGNLWFSAGGELMKFDGKNWKNFTREKEIDGALLFEDKKGNLWFRMSGGVAKYDGENLSTYTEKDGIFLDWVSEIFEDGKGNIWFKTSNGLTFFDGENWRRYTTEHGLAHNDVRAIHEDTSGNLWMGTYGGGISRFDGTQFTNYTTEHGLSSNQCYFIIEHDNYLYFGTPKGLNRFDGETFKLYTASDGLASTSVGVDFPDYYGGFLKDSKGNLWFTSVKGLTRYNPQADRPNIVPPPIYITGLKIFGKDKTVTSGFELGYAENNVRFDYVGLCFTSPEDVIYSYKLEGLDEDWIETYEHYMTYPFLPSGEYIFKVRARNKDGVWSKKKAELAFKIKPPFWATTWFKGSILAVFLLVFWGVYQARTRSMKKRNIELGREITARKKVEEDLRQAYSEVELLKNRLQAENIYLKEEIKIFHDFDEIITNSEPLKRVLFKVEQVAKTDTTVLILGETGTGKQLLACAVHKLSTRCDRPLVTVNCSALPASLIESELFGHEKGAFTSAFSRKIGRFELADEGSIFLDEIGDLPLELQPKLLRVLQEGEFERLGSSLTIKVDVRVIAATNRNLEKAVEKGGFRADLYYRLNVYPIKCPPLREHKEDIPLLVNHFVRKYGAKTGKNIETIPQQVMETLQAYHWPGNVRELENVIERAVIVSQGNQFELGEWLPKAGVSSSKSHISSLEDNEREHIIKALELTGWRVSGEKGAAKILGIKSPTLVSRMKKLGIERKNNF